jgi:porphobilinogen synthase
MLVIIIQLSKTVAESSKPSRRLPWGPCPRGVGRILATGPRGVNPLDKKKCKRSVKAREIKENSSKTMVYRTPPRTQSHLKRAAGLENALRNLVPMFFPQYRPRRLRASQTLREVVRETALHPNDFVLPLFLVPGSNIETPIASLPGVSHLSVDRAVESLKPLVDLGLRSVILFGLPESKDDEGSSAWDPEGPVQRGCAALKASFPELLVLTDVCLCQYTSHGHCGELAGHTVANDPTLERLALVALSHAMAGADIVAPSDMMDGRVWAIRETLERSGYQDTAIMSYAVKYASAFYGPFRDAADSKPAAGDRKSYQMDPANRREAMREARLDIHEGADILMVKPALSYLDIISDLRRETDYPLAAYHVSGEYSMVKAAAERGWIDEKAVMLEVLTSIKRAGAGIIITYAAGDACRWLQSR